MRRSCRNGFGSSLMAMNPFDAQTLTLAFPTATLGALPAASGGAAAKLGDADQALLDAGQAEGPWSSAESMAYDEVIDPRELRNVLLDGLDLAVGREAQAPEPAHHAGIRP